MKADKSNPESNQLPTGISETELVNAIEASGYPLQGIVASKLDSHFSVTEEWGYIDRDSKDHRALDIFAHKRLHEDNNAPIQPNLVLLIECKRSRHPYVFFENVIERSIPGFPFVSGLPRDRVSISEQNGNRSRDAFGEEVLGLSEFPLIEPGPPKCAAFSKGIPSGKKVKLSGTDPFNSLVLPLVKALDHSSQLYQAIGQSSRVFPTLTFCISVLDAPMILVKSPESASAPILTPWTRITRLEANPDPRSRLRYRFYAVDAVHIDHFNEVLHDHILPFAAEFSKRAVRLGNVLLNGGMVPDLSNWGWDQIHEKPTN